MRSKKSGKRSGSLVGSRYATGVSNGGCEPASPIAAIAVVAATVPEALPAECKADRAVSALFVFGDQDPIVKMGGGAVARDRRRALSLAAAVDFSRRRDGITEAPVRAEPRQRNTDDGTSILQESATGGESNSEVTLYLVHGGGHTWPGGRPYLPVNVRKTSSQLDASRPPTTCLGRASIALLLSTDEPPIALDHPRCAVVRRRRVDVADDVGGDVLKDIRGE
jgi:poly(3-hydroxybutyrate) depolymerase